MIDPERIPLIIRILNDYQRFKGRKVKDKALVENVIAELNGERVRKKRAKGHTIMKTKTDLAKEFGMTRKTLIKYIRSHDDLFDDLTLAGYINSQRGFTPKEVQIIKEFMGVTK